MKYIFAVVAIFLFGIILLGGLKKEEIKPMGYIDQTDLESAITAKRLGEMLDDAGTWSEGDTYSGDMDDALEYCIERASGLIDGYLRGKYTVPLDTDNLSDSSKSLIQQWTIDLTIYLLNLS